MLHLVASLWVLINLSQSVSPSGTTFRLRMKETRTVYLPCRIRGVRVGNAPVAISAQSDSVVVQGIARGRGSWAVVCIDGTRLLYHVQVTR